LPLLFRSPPLTSTVHYPPAGVRPYVRPSRYSTWPACSLVSAAVSCSADAATSRRRYRRLVKDVAGVHTTLRGRALPAFATRTRLGVIIAPAVACAKWRAPQQSQSAGAAFHSGGGRVRSGIPGPEWGIWKLRATGETRIRRWSPRTGGRPGGY